MNAADTGTEAWDRDAADVLAGRRSSMRTIGDRAVLDGDERRLAGEVRVDCVAGQHHRHAHCRRQHQVGNAFVPGADDLSRADDELSVMPVEHGAPRGVL